MVSAPPTADPFAALPLAIEPLRVDDRAPERLQQRSPFMVSVLLATLLHGSAFAWVLLPYQSTLVGGGGDNLDAISVELVTASAIAAQSISAKRDRAVATPAQLDATTGSSLSQSTAAAATPEPAQERPEPERREPAERAAIEPDALEAQPPEPVVPRQRAETAAVADPTPAASQGGASAVSLAPAAANAPADAAVAVSAGSIRTVRPQRH